jgi:hypothetical protein
LLYWYKSTNTDDASSSQQQQQQNADVLLRKDAGSLRQEIAARMRRFSEHAGGIAASKTDVC